jgi:hypothetical protein
MAALSDEQKAVRAAYRGVSEILALHTVTQVGGLKYCELCFENWPCQTNKIAKVTLVKIKKGLPQQ